MTTELQEKNVNPPTEGEAYQEKPEYLPDADIYEFEDHFLLAVDLPGVDEAHANIEVKDRVLEVTGEPVVEDPANHEVLHRGWYAGRYRRAFEIGNRIDRDGIKANLKNGTLRIVLPKAKEAQPRKISINVAS